MSGDGGDAFGQKWRRGLAIISTCGALACNPLRRCGLPCLHLEGLKITAEPNNLSLLSHPVSNGEVTRSEWCNVVFNLGLAHAGFDTSAG